MITIDYETKNLQTENKITRSLLVLPVADPGFPRGRDANAARGPPTYAKFSQKLHEIERIWTLRGVHPSRPLRSASGYICQYSGSVKDYLS